MSMFNKLNTLNKRFKPSDPFETFAVFFKIGALTFGGGYAMLPLLQRDIVQRLGWATDEEVLDYYAISQSLPGIVAANTAMLIGYGRGKIPGLAAAVLGIALPSLLIILAIAMFIENFLYIESVGHAFNGIRAAVAALVAGTAVKMLEGCVRDSASAAIFLTALAAFAFMDVYPAIPVVAGALAGAALKGRGGSL
ncbi:MAG: chromate transporter [Synergistaceae bacterium]|jgi:chromate transporter|nr:chromate transporter [Synergistaceae bacterium]